jgi:Flp pilus assembly protein TadD
MLLVAAATATAFWPATGNDFVFDDRSMLLTERRATGGFSGDALAWAVTSTDFSLYHPLARLSALLDFQLHGKNPSGHHLTSLLLHGAVNLMVFLALVEFTGAVWKSAAVAALCAVHPLRVEPAAWIGGRADLLAAIFGILALLAWGRHLRRRSRAWAAVAVGAFTLGMLSKTIVMTLPFVLLLLDYWPLGRLRPDREGRAQARPAGNGPGIAALFKEKAGLFMVATLMAGMALFLLQRGAVAGPLATYPLPARAATILVSYATYVCKTLWPASLTVFYPHRWGAFAWWEVGGAVLLLSALSAVALLSARRRPFLAVGWLWFLGMLLPVIGLYQARQYPVADRYTYLPQIGLFVMAVWGLEGLVAGRSRNKVLVSALVLALVLACIPASLAQVRHWKDEAALFAHALAVTSGNWLAHNNLGEVLLRQGREEEAAAQFTQALRLRPAYPEALNNLGIVYARQGRLEEALASCREALRLWPGSPGVHYNLGNALLALGRFEEAAAHFREALRLRPEYPEARNNLGAALFRQGDYGAAAQSFREALRLSPDDAETRANMELALRLQQGNR